jgi:S1-C subfamily serine protease
LKKVDELIDHGVSSDLRLGISGYKVLVEYDNRLVAGLQIESVDSQSPAYLAGLMNGDILVSSNGHAVTSLGDILESIDSAVGEICVDFYRDGRNFTTSVTF